MVLLQPQHRAHYHHQEIHSIQRIINKHHSPFSSRSVCVRKCSSTDFFGFKVPLGSVVWLKSILGRMNRPSPLPRVTREKCRSVFILSYCVFFFLQLLFNFKSISLIALVHAAPVLDPGPQHHQQDVSSASLTPPETFTAVHSVKSVGIVNLYRFIAGQNKFGAEIEFSHTIAGIYAALWLLVRRLRWPFEYRCAIQ